MTADWCLWCVVLLAFFQVCAQIHGWHGFTPFILVCLWFKGNYAAHRFSSGTYVKTRCFSQKAATWNIHVIQNTDSCCSLACRRARTNPIATPGRRRKWASGIVRADLPKLVTQLRDSRQASKVCFDRLSAPPHPPTPPQQSIHQSRPQFAPELVMCAHQLSACGNWRQTKGEKAKRAVLTVHRKRGRHIERRRLRGLDPSPSAHSLKGLFSCSKQSGWKAPEWGGSVTDYNRGREEYFSD